MFSSSDELCWHYLEPVCPAFNVGSGYFWFVVGVMLLVLYVDMTYFFRSRCDRLIARLNRQPTPPALFSSHLYTGLCLTTATDFSDSMSSAAVFLRECDLALRHFLCTSHLGDALSALNCRLYNSSNNLKFRRPLCFLQSYCIHTRLTWWDEHSMYIEQKLVSPGERGAVCAVNYSRQIVQGVRMDDLLRWLCVCTCLPREPPPEIESWIVCTKIVNRQLTLAGQY